MSFLKSTIKQQNDWLPVVQSKKFKNYDQFYLQHCFKKALELEGTYQISEGVNVVRPTDVLHMYHKEEDDKICEINKKNRDNKARNNAYWKCGEVGHFSRECPLNETKETNTQDRYAGKVQHTYTGSTPVTGNARSFILHLYGVVLMFLIAFAIVPKVLISLVVHKYISCDFGECCESVP